MNGRLSLVFRHKGGFTKSPVCPAVVLCTSFPPPPLSSPLSIAFTIEAGKIELGERCEPDLGSVIRVLSIWWQACPAEKEVAAVAAGLQRFRGILKRGPREELPPS